MSMPDVALILVALLFGIYGWLSGLELGISLLRLSPSSEQLTGRRLLFTPLWEITNVFLVFGFTGFSIFFSNALNELSRGVFNTLALAMTALLLRACLVLYIFNYKDKYGVNLANLLFVVFSALVPLSFLAVGIFLLTGQSFTDSSLGRLMMVSFSSGLLALALSFVKYIRGGPNVNHAGLSAMVATVVLAGTATLGLQQSISQSNHLTGPAFTFWSGLNYALLLFTVLLIVLNKRKWLWVGLSVLAVTGPILWALANRPYLVYPGLLANAYGAQAFDKAAMIGLAVMFPLMALGLGLFAKLYISQPRK